MLVEALSASDANGTLGTATPITIPANGPVTVTGSIGDEPAVMIEWSGARTWAGRERRFLDRALATLLVVDIVESTSIVSGLTIGQ